MTEYRGLDEEEESHTFHISFTRVFPSGFLSFPICLFPGTGASNILLSTCT